MSNYEPNPSDQSPIGEKIPHSGVHGFEKPVTEFDKTTLRDAHAQGLIKTPETPASLHQAQEKKDFPTWARYMIGSVAASIVLGGGAVAYQMKRANDFVEDLNKSIDQPVATSTEGPVGVDLPPTTEKTPEYHFTMEPVTLTDAEVATLKAGDGEKSHKILDAKLIPKIQEAVDQIRKNGGMLSGLDLSALTASNKAVLDLAQINELSSSDEIQICDTTPNVDGSINFCGPSNFTRIELGKPIDFYYNNYATEKDSRFSTDTHAEIVDGNRLILTD